MRFEVTILGCSSATPTSNRFPTAQVINLLERFFLVDCGEGTQMQMRKYKIKMQSINHVFISHLHGDHYFGLVGLLSTMHLLGRKAPLYLYAHKDLKKIIDIQLNSSDTYLNYEIIFHPLRYDEKEVLVDDKLYSIETIILKHRIQCCGFLFKEKAREKGVRRDKIKEYNIPYTVIPSIKKGEDFITEKGETIPNHEITVKPPYPRSYAYCSDTAYIKELSEVVKGVDLLYHEATFMDNMKLRAKETFHSTTLEAASIAKDAGAKKLLIGHYSARYHDTSPLVDEARTIFPDTEASKEGVTYIV
jgi:ribonuclease Z